MQGAGRAAGDLAWPPRPRWGKRGLCGRPADALTALADRVADLAAAETRALVRTVAGLLTTDGQAGVLEAIERAAQACAATIGLAAIAGVINWPASRSRPVPAAHASRPIPAGWSDDVPERYGPCSGCWASAAATTTVAPASTRAARAGSPRSMWCSVSPAAACHPVWRGRQPWAGAEMPYAKGFTFIGTVTGLDLASTSTLARTTRSHGNRARH